MDKSKLLKNLLSALELMPDGAGEENAEACEGMDDLMGKTKPDMKDAEGVEVVKIKALGEEGEGEEAVEEEEDEESPFPKKKKSFFT